MTKCSEFSTTSTESSNIPLVDLKIGPPTGTRPQFFLLWRFKDPNYRPDWKVFSSQKCEQTAIMELEEMSEYNQYSDYLLVAKWPKDRLDDPIPY